MVVPLTPLDFLRRARKLHGDREAVVDGDARFTYTQFADRIDRWTAGLRALGVTRGDRVAYIAPNTHANLEGYYAVPLAGAAIVPINFRLTADDFAYLITHSGAKVVCAHADQMAAVDQVRERLPASTRFVALEGGAAGWLDYEALLAGQAAVPTASGCDEGDLISINYTSGTTSRPKGVMITHRNAYMNAVGILAHLPMRVGDRYLWTLPMFHANGWTFTWIVTAIGGTHVCLRKVEPAQVFALIRRERISMLCAAPTVLISLAHADPALRVDVPRGVRVVTAGAPPAAATIAAIEDGLGWDVTHMYGLTETSPFITVCDRRPEDIALGPAERARIKSRQGVELITSGELKVVTPEGDEVPRDGQSLGEIVARGNVVMAGYYNDPDATAAVMRDGWFHSGDAAVVHPDGYVEIRDRIKDVIISGGENISSVEVEATLIAHPAVMEVAVVGMPHEKWGEAPYAFVVLKPGGAATADALRTFCRARLAHFKVPHDFTFVTELPRTATGKVQKFVLRKNQPGITAQ
ncbi:MAG TPA: long-chain-fatty-acid--CoA ligase [Vicinamibacterales bacterium]|nr:long-chain-fatty-acid--CoA ligase [Vicinamibacterales bacterium]